MNLNEGGQVIFYMVPFAVSLRLSLKHSWHVANLKIGFALYEDGQRKPAERWIKLHFLYWYICIFFPKRGAK